MSSYPPRLTDNDPHLSLTEVESGKCHDCGMPKSENQGGLNAYEADSGLIEVCDDCLRQRHHDDEDDGKRCRECGNTPETGACFFCKGGLI